MLHSSHKQSRTETSAFSISDYYCNFLKKKKKKAKIKKKIQKPLKECLIKHIIRKTFNRNVSGTTTEK